MHAAPRLSGPRRPPLAESAGVAAVALVVYLLATLPVSGDADGSEFTLALATCGVPHPTGYPIFTLAGHLFCRLLHGLGAPWPYAANAWSAVGAAVAVFFLHALALRLIEPARPPAWVRSAAALLPVLLFAVNPIWMESATLAEVYSWHIALVCGMAWVCSGLLERVTDPGRGADAGLVRDAALWGLLCGLGLAHHLTSVLVSVPLSIGLIVALVIERKLRPAQVLAAFGAALVPLLSYTYILWRAYHPAQVQWEGLEPSLRGVLAHITGERYRHFLGYFQPSDAQRVLLARAGYPVLIPGLALLLLGALRARGEAARIRAWSLLAAALAVTLHASNYGVLDPAAYFLPALALGLAALAPPAAELIAGSAAAPRPVVAALAVAVPIAIAAVLAPWVRDAMDRRVQLLNFERVVRSMWSAVPDRVAIVIWPDDRFTRLIEYQVLRHEKPRLVVIDPEIMVDDLPRARFAARFGVDPLEGIPIPQLAPGSPGERAAIARVLWQMVLAINARSSVPVIVFDLGKPEVRLLGKPHGSPGAVR